MRITPQHPLVEAVQAWLADDPIDAAYPRRAGEVMKRINHYAKKAGVLWEFRTPQEVGRILSNLDRESRYLLRMRLLRVPYRRSDRWRIILYAFG